MHAIKWFLPYVTKHKLRLSFAYLLDLIFILSSLVNPYMTGRIVAEVLQDGLNERLIPYLCVMLVNTLLRSGIRYGFLLLIETMSQDITLTLRQDLYARLHRQNFAFFDANRVGDIMARMTGDLEAIRTFTAHDICAVPENILLFCAAMVMMFSLSWQLALCMLAIAPVIMFAAYHQAKAIKPAFRHIREQFSHLNSVCAENIGGNRVIKAFATEDHEIEKFTQANEAYFNSHVQTTKVWVKYLPIMETCAALLPLVLVLIGSLLVIGGYMELWQMITFNGYLWMVNQPMRLFGNYVNNAQNFFTSLDQVYGMMRKSIYIKSPENALCPERLTGEVTFKHVNFAYDRFDPRALVLKDISFHVEKGWTVGIVGATGAGKTTITHLLSRFYDVTSGEVLMDGVNVQNYDLHALRRCIASAMQDVFLFSDTVEGNIAFGVPDTPVQTVYDAAVVADADGFIRQMPEGYDTIVGERGVGLSGGQRQRISLARALAVDPSILILDDTTSAVDMETEQRIQAALKHVFADKPRTTFIIAHRLSSVKAADLILVLEDGVITERGKHDELMALGGYYAKQYAEQLGGDACGA